MGTGPFREIKRPGPCCHPPTSI